MRRREAQAREADASAHDDMHGSGSAWLQSAREGKAAANEGRRRAKVEGEKSSSSSLPLSSITLR